MNDLYARLYLPSLLIPLAVLLPNLFFFMTKPVNPPAQSNENLKGGRLLETLERIGQAGVTVAPVFYRPDWSSMANYVAFGLMILTLAIYYGCWARYFLCGRRHSLLFAPLWFIPIPMATSPIMFLLCGAKLLNSPILLTFALLLAIGHIPISYHEYRRCERSGAGNERSSTAN